MPNPVRVAIETLGCKLNQAESEALARQLVSTGYDLVASEDNPDIVIVNTCTVTATADRKSRQLLRRWGDNVLTLATGCYARRVGESLKGLSCLAMPEKSNLVDRLRALRPADGRVGTDSSQRTRSFVKIQDGCINRCAYCIVPLVRHDPSSVCADAIVRQVQERVEKGYAEVILTGTEIGSYRDDSLDLTGLIGRLLDETQIRRLRLSSLQPQEITPGLLDRWRDPRLCRHFHLSLQSGSDSVLSRMRRRYETAVFSEAVERIKKAIPGAAVTTDIIVGFPGETEAEFETSYQFCRQMGFARIHVFPFSPRPGTEAAGMSGQVDRAVVRQRASRMRALASESARDFRRPFSGHRLPVLWEEKKGLFWYGYSDNYIRLRTCSDADLANQITMAPVD